MFNGIVTALGVIIAYLEKENRDVIVSIKSSLAKQLAIGSSIACSGVCLTVTEKTEESFTVNVSHETLRCTNLSTWKGNTKINLEPSLTLTSAINGHFIYGHVDEVVKMQAIERAQDSHKLLLVVEDKSLMQFIVPKGAVALDGISLTVNEVWDKSFSVNIIPHTWQVTTLQYIYTGSLLNMEVDILAKYVAKALQYK